MNYNIEINGILVNGTYTDANIKEIFIPLLRHLTSLQKEKNKRILVLLAAPPGAGKSTLCSFLKYLSEHTPGLHPVQVIGMDGFHRYQDYLTSHTTIRDGKEILMVDIKGAPVTFDFDLLRERMERIANGECCGWPDYNRLTHNPAENAVTVTGDIVLLEGNYLLLNEPGWNELRYYADYTIKISADEKILRARLIDRKIKSGTTKEEAVSFVEHSDLYNAKLCLTHSQNADLNLVLKKDNSYALEANSMKRNRPHTYSSEPDIPNCGCIYG